MVAGICIPFFIIIIIAGVIVIIIGGCKKRPSKPPVPLPQSKDCKELIEKRDDPLRGLLCDEYCDCAFACNPWMPVHWKDECECECLTYGPDYKPMLSALCGPPPEKPW